MCYAPVLIVPEEGLYVAPPSSSKAQNNLKSQLAITFSLAQEEEQQWKQQNVVLWVCLLNGMMNRFDLIVDTYSQSRIPRKWGVVVEMLARELGRSSVRNRNCMQHPHPLNGLGERMRRRMLNKTKFCKTVQ